MSTRTRNRPTTASGVARRERSELHAQVLRGVSLTILLRERREPLDGVPLYRLVRWVPFVGPVKARRILLGLPERARLGELRPDARDLLTSRVADAEKSLLYHAIHHYRPEA